MSKITTIGDRVKLKKDNLCGTVRFIGEIQGKNSIYYGIELDKSKGKNNGTVNKICYFKCKRKHGLFVKKSNIIKTNAKHNQTAPRITVGDQVYCINEKCNGIIRFIGTPFSITPSGIFYGIELEKPRGKYKGTINGRYYFKCKYKYADFLQPNDFSIIDTYEDKDDIKSTNINHMKMQKQIIVTKNKKSKQKQKTSHITINNQKDHTDIATMLARQNITIDEEDRIGICLQTMDDEKQSDSVHIYQSNKYILQVSLYSVFNITETTKIIVIAFIHSVERTYDFEQILSNDILNVCAVFYDCFIDLPKKNPFTILFAMFDLHSALSIDGWDLLQSEKQCNYLKMYKLKYKDNREALLSELLDGEYDCSGIDNRTKIRVQNEVLIMFSKFYDLQTALLKNEKVIKWSMQDILVSLIYYFVKDTAVEIQQNGITWEFVELFRRYCNDTHLNGRQLAGLVTTTELGVGGYGSFCIFNVCSRYGKITKVFSKLTKSLTAWSKKLNVQEESSQTYWGSMI
eukprot:474199_1